MRSIIAIAALLAGLLAAGPLDAQDPGAGFVIIAHPGVADDECSKRTFQRIYLGKKGVWDDATPIRPCTLRGGDLHDEFVDSVLGRSVSRYESYWKQAVFTGRGIPPRAFTTEDELAAYVAATPGAVGYISVGAVPSDVKIIRCR